ncbi:hypothetical protein Ga0080574_TMP395 (plasmid) [Salipiger abyssi]|uniref:Uncharacterized protein n=1 Tax=Salipiger abyssi TaxID=1250539 RepID=A0A1P8UMV3_9RHOB|nr:hypothetical protein Ga0080574_TMP395 [Salipiger abyssi]
MGGDMRHGIPPRFFRSAPAPHAAPFRPGRCRLKERIAALNTKPESHPAPGANPVRLSTLAAGWA